MRRIGVIISLLLAGCQAAAPVLTPGATHDSKTSTAVQQPSPIHPQNTNPEPPFEVRLHPDGGLYVGDLVSIEIIPWDDQTVADLNVVVHADSPDGPHFGPFEFSPFGIGSRLQATLQWVWDTSELAPGIHTLTFSTSPEEITWSQTIELLPEETLPPLESQAVWTTTNTECCMIHYITGTASARDIHALALEADSQAATTIDQLGVDFSETIEITLMPRLIGHGGFAGQEIYISYLDRNYAGSSYPIVLHHEMVHILDDSLGGDLRPTLFVEGLAVFLVGGHFKIETLLLRAAALFDLDWDLPLIPLCDNFYPSQHEIGYIMAGALTHFMVLKFGWEAFVDFYRDIHYTATGKQSDAINEALMIHFDIQLEDLEAQFVDFLNLLPSEEQVTADVRLTIKFYDTVRRYQQLLDPSAYYLSAWLIWGDQLRERGVVADLIRHPHDRINLLIETMLVNAERLLDTGDYTRTERHIAAVNAVLDVVETNPEAVFNAHPLAKDYAEVISVLTEVGFTPQEISLFEDSGKALVYLISNDLITVDVTRTSSGWIITANEQ